MNLRCQGDILQYHIATKKIGWIGGLTIFVYLAVLIWQSQNRCKMSGDEYNGST